MKLAIVLLVLMSGCATTGKISRVSVGMDRARVIEELGTPYAARTENGTEVLEYQFNTNDWGAMVGITKPHYVRLKDGKVTEYGRAPASR